MQFCINTGDVTYGRIKKPDGKEYYDYGSAFVGYTNSAFTTIKYCIDTGNVKERENSVCDFDFNIFVGLSSADASEYDVQSVYMLHKDQYEYFSYNGHELFSSVANTYLIEPYEGIIPTTPDDLSSGKVAYAINQAAKDDKYTSAFKKGFAFYQKIGEDAIPSVDSSRGWVVLSGDTYTNGEPKAEPPETTKAPETTSASLTTQISETTASPSVTTSPEAEPPVQSGCTGFSCQALLILIICAACLWRKWTVISGQKNATI